MTEDTDMADDVADLHRHHPTMPEAVDVVVLFGLAAADTDASSIWITGCAALRRSESQAFNQPVRSVQLDGPTSAAWLAAFYWGSAGGRW